MENKISAHQIHKMGKYLGIFFILLTLGILVSLLAVPPGPRSAGIDKEPRTHDTATVPPTVKRNQEQPLFITPAIMPHERLESFIYEYQNNPTIVTEQQKMRAVRDLTAKGKYKKVEISNNSIIYKSGVGDEEKNIVVMDSQTGLDSWLFAQLDPNAVLCTMNGGEEPCPVSAEEVEKDATERMDKVFPTLDYTVSSYEGAGVYNVIISPVIDEIEVPVPFVFEYSSTGVLVYASGYFAIPKKDKSIRTIGPKNTITYLNNTIPWPSSFISQTTIPLSEQAQGESLPILDSADGTEVYVDKGIPSWKLYVTEGEEKFYLVPSYIFVPSGKNRAWNVFAVEEATLKEIS